MIVLTQFVVMDKVKYSFQLSTLIFCFCITLTIVYQVFSKNYCIPEYQDKFSSFTLFPNVSPAAGFIASQKCLLRHIFFIKFLSTAIPVIANQGKIIVNFCLTQGTKYYQKHMVKFSFSFTLLPNVSPAAVFIASQKCLLRHMFIIKFLSTAIPVIANQ